MDEYLALAREAEQYKSDYQQAARDCGLTQAAIMLTGFLVSNFSPALPAPSAGTAAQLGAELNALEQFYNFLSLVDKVTSGDGSWLLPDTSFKDFAKIPNPAGGVLGAEDIYDGLSSALGFLEGYVGEPSPEALLDDLRNCGGFTLEPIMDDAIHYLRLLQEIQPLMRDAQQTLNRLEDLDEEIFNKWSRWRQECLEYESCREGGNPANCEQLPSMPNP
jgi:hypothetical protein